MINLNGLEDLDKISLVNAIMLYKLTLENEEKSKDMKEKLERLERVESKLDAIISMLGEIYGK